MLATFAVEIVAALLLLVTYKSSRLQRLSVVTLLLLATFQLAEYNVCGRLGVDAQTWSRIGYVAITLLPPLGLHIVYEIGKRKFDWLLALAYGSGAVFAGLFAFGSVFESYACGGNYVIFQLQNPAGGLFMIYYYLWLFYTIFLAVLLMHQKRLAHRRKTALLNLIIGYALFMVPTSLAIVMFPESADALPSVMCGFAVLFALVLTFMVVPYTEKKKPTRRS